MQLWKQSIIELALQISCEKMDYSMKNIETMIKFIYKNECWLNWKHKYKENVRVSEDNRKHFLRLQHLKLRENDTFEYIKNVCHKALVINVV